MQSVCVKTITYPLRLDAQLYGRVRKEARRRKRKLADVFRDSISLGLAALPPMPDPMEDVIGDSWEKLGPAPEIDYDKL
jgi:hypothetical protein